MERLVDLKSRAKRTLTIQLCGRVPGRVSARVTRDVARLDRDSGKMRYREMVVRCPPVLRIAPGQLVEGLPESVLGQPAVAAYIRRRALVVVKNYLPESDAPATTPTPATPEAPKARRGRKG